LVTYLRFQGKTIGTLLKLMQIGHVTCHRKSMFLGLKAGVTNTIGHIMKSDVFGITMSTLPFKSLGSVQVLFIYFIIIIIIIF